MRARAQVEYEVDQAQDAAGVVASWTLSEGCQITQLVVVETQTTEIDAEVPATETPMPMNVDGEGRPVVLGGD